MFKVREATEVHGMPMGSTGEDGFCFSVGRNLYLNGKTPHVVTRITITEDLPGPHCFLERVRVYVGETVVFEAPLHNMQAAFYMPKTEAA